WPGPPRTCRGTIIKLNAPPAAAARNLRRDSREFFRAANFGSVGISAPGQFWANAEKRRLGVTQRPDYTKSKLATQCTRRSERSGTHRRLPGVLADNLNGGNTPSDRATCRRSCCPVPGVPIR